MTAVAVMMLTSRGRFSLTDPVVKCPARIQGRPVAPDACPAAPPRVTVQDLLLHTSGLASIGRRSSLPARVRVRTDTLPQFFSPKSLRAPALMEDPGTWGFRYSEAPPCSRRVDILVGPTFDMFLAERFIGAAGDDGRGPGAPRRGSAHAARARSAPAPGVGLAAIEIELGRGCSFTAGSALLEGWRGPL